MSSSDLIVPGAGMGGVSLGDTEDQIRSVLGHPVHEDRSANEVWVRFDDIAAQIWPGNGECVYLWAWSSRLGLESGLAVGSNWHDLVSEFPTAFFDLDWAAWLSSPDVGITFSLITRDRREPGYSEVDPDDALVSSIGVHLAGQDEVQWEHATPWEITLDHRTGRFRLQIYEGTPAEAIVQAQESLELLLDSEGTEAATYSTIVRGAFKPQAR